MFTHLYAWIVPLKSYTKVQFIALCGVRCPLFMSTYWWVAYNLNSILFSLDSQYKVLCHKLLTFYIGIPGSDKLQNAIVYPLVQFFVCSPHCLFIYLSGFQSYRHLQRHMATFSFYWWRKTTHVRISEYSQVWVEPPTHRHYIAINNEDQLCNWTVTL